MQRLLTLALSCLISTGLAFAQGKVTQNPPTSGVQSTQRSVTTAPNQNGTLPSSSAQAASRPSRSNQALPGSTNPANAAADEGNANGKAVAPDQSQNGSAAPTDPNAKSNANPMAPVNANPNRGNPSGMGWFWIALAIVIALFVIGLMIGRRAPRGSAAGRRADVSRMPDRDQIRRDDQQRRIG